MTSVDLNTLVDRVVAGERGAVARCLRLVDDDPARGRAIALGLHGRLKGAQVVGITGNPGAGKSTLVDGLIKVARTRGRRVAVLAVDPSSPYSGGAILGDRIRMSQHSGDDGVFIRSLATRGALGGLSRATAESVRVLDAAGFDLVLVETVGVGQDEVDIARLAETTIVVLMPGAGDDVQAIKAGILEIADVFLINKADREGAAEVEKGLRQMLSLAPGRTRWEIPILRAVASRGEGLEALSDAVEAHHRFMESDEGVQRARERREDTFERLLDAALVEQGRAGLAAGIDAARARVRDDGADPYVEVHGVVSPRPR
jgi:LAO/AO transport system kinase